MVAKWTLVLERANGSKEARSGLTCFPTPLALLAQLIHAARGPTHRLALR